MYKIFSNTLFLGKEVVYLPTCHSTNDIASDLLARNRPEGALVITDDQTAGRGQRGNTWHSEPGQNLTFSVLFRPTFVAPSRPFSLHLFVSLALHDWLTQLGLTTAKVKWPNDLYLGERKLGGILIENTLKGARMAGSVVGIGLNIHQTKFGSLRATSLALEMENPPALAAGLESMLLCLERRYLQLKQGREAQLWQTYQAVLLGKGELRRYEDERGVFEGVLQEVLPNGQAVIVDGQRQSRAYHHGEVTWRF